MKYIHVCCNDLLFLTLNMKSFKSTDSHQDKSSYKAWVLFMLLVVYIFNFIDRQIIGILAVPIQAENLPRGR